MIARLTLFALFALATIPSARAGEYVIEGAFEGCEHGRYYGLRGRGLLECREYNYFYDYMPTVLADGRDVMAIGGQRVDAVLSNGSLITTKIVGDFDGCDFDTRYEMDNGLIFVCQTYSYSYAYRPDVQIAIPEGGSPVVSIKGKVYRGQVFRR